MKKVLIIAILAVFATNIASAQDPAKVIETWKETFTVPASQGTIIERLFATWSAKYPGKYVDAYNKFKKTGNADKIKISEEEVVDFNVDLAAKNGYLEIMEMVETSNTLTAVYWNLPNGNKLFGVSIEECHECDDSEDTKYSDCCTFALVFYEYNPAKGTMTPRPEIASKILGIAESVTLPKEGRDIEYYDDKAGEYKTIKWNGNGF